MRSPYDCHVVDEPVPLVALIGAPRSGTTWLQNLLGADPRAVSPQETSLFSRFVAPLDESWQWGMRGTAEDWARRRFIGLGSVLTEDEFTVLVHGFVQEALVKVLAMKPGASLVVEKTPSHSHHVDLIARYAPQVRFLHIIRDGRDSAASLVAASKGWGESWGAPSTVTRAAYMWANHVNGARRAGEFGPYHEVRYEDLRSDKASDLLEEIFEFCGIPIDASEARHRLDEYSLNRQRSEGTSSVVFAGEAARHEHAGAEPSGFFGAGNANWRDCWTVRDRVDFDAVAGPLLLELGYEKNDAWLGPQTAVGTRAPGPRQPRPGGTRAARARAPDRARRTTLRRRRTAVIVSHEHKFIFLKTRKTAGTSIEVFLAPLLRVDAIITPVAEVPHPARNFEQPRRRYRSLLAGSHVWEMQRDIERQRWFFNHIGARLIRARLGPRVWNSYYKFCFERDPWEKTVSWYHYRFAEEPDAPTFAEYVKQGELPTDFDRYSLDGASIGVDFVGRFENLVGDLEHALGQIGLDVPVTLTKEKGRFRPRDASVQEVFDAEASARVEQVFSREIAAFGYAAPASR